VGPRHIFIDPDGVRTDAILIASPHPNPTHVLGITCVAIPSLGQVPEIFQFHGGFDAPEIMTDPSKVAGFLAFLYPVLEAGKLRDRLGSVDYVPK
jgi:hypothetical protein